MDIGIDRESTLDQENGGKSTLKEPTKRNTPKIADLIRTACNNPNMTHAEIAKLYNLERSTVSHRLAPYKDFLATFRDYSEDKAAYLTTKEAELLHSITKKKIDKAGLRDIGTVYGILSDKRRLEEGQSTDNLAIKLIFEVQGHDSVEGQSVKDMVQAAISGGKDASSLPLDEGG